jgi:hypothetical protein
MPAFTFFDHVSNDPAVETTPIGPTSVAGRLTASDPFNNAPYSRCLQGTETTTRIVSMSQQDIDHLDSLMKELAWWLDVYFQNCDQALFCCYFKTIESKPTVEWVLRQVHEFVAAYLDRNSTAAECGYNVRFFKALSDSGNTFASCAPRLDTCEFVTEKMQVDITLRPCVWTCYAPIADFLTFRVLPFDVRTWYFGSNMVRVLLHDLVHSVTTTWKFVELAEQTGINAYLQRHDILLDIMGFVSMITDVNPRAFQDKSSKEDAVLIDEMTFEGTVQPAYGARPAKCLAAMGHGAVAALLNADNYAYLITEVAIKYLTFFMQPDEDMELQQAYSEMLRIAGDASDDEEVHATIRACLRRRNAVRQDCADVADVFCARRQCIKELLLEAPETLPDESTTFAKDFFDAFTDLKLGEPTGSDQTLLKDQINLRRHKTDCAVKLCNGSDVTQ